MYTCIVFHSRWTKPKRTLSYLVDRGLECRHRLECREEQEEGEGYHDDVLHDAPLLRPQLLLAEVHPPVKIVRVHVELFKPFKL